MTMNVRNPIKVAAAVVVLLLVFLIWKTRTPVQNELPVSTNADTPSVHQDVLAQQPRATPDASDNAKQLATVINDYRRGQISKSDAVRAALSTLNDVPIDFYGKLSDQFGNAVSGAEIKASIRIINGERAGTDVLNTKSDAFGLFEFHGKGQDIAVVPHKPGYALATTETVFKYSHLDDHPFASEANNPTTIKMWKLQGAEPLTAIGQRFKLPYTGKAINVDLLTGQILDLGGDLIITVSRPQGTISGQNRQEWSVNIAAVDGGLIEADGQESVTYSAPEGGYQPSITLSAPTNGHGVELIQDGLFVKSRNGAVYSKLGFSLRINSDPTSPFSLAVNGVANASGSRNWEGDPNTMAAVGDK